MIHTGDIDLRGGPTQLSGVTGPVSLLVKCGSRVLGRTDRFVLGPGDGTRLLDELRRTYAAALIELPLAHPEAPAFTAADITIVICTRDRPEFLDGCLSAVASLDPAPGEVVVVDNASGDDRTRRMVGSRGVTVVAEPTPGLDRARNTGWRVAQRPLVAYVDDDARPDPGFAAAVAAAFRHPAIGAVTGLVVPAELATAAQTAFERLEGGMGKGYEPRLFTRSEVGLQAFRLGVGTNMTYRRTTLETLGGFDPRLDVGTATRGGGDLDMLWRVVAAGWVVAYEPDALVRHIHRRHHHGLLAQLRDNGTAYRAFLELRRRSDPSLEAAVRREIVRWHLRRHLVRPLRALAAGRPGVARMALSEWVGSLRGRAALAAATAAATEGGSGHG